MTRAAPITVSAVVLCLAACRSGRPAADAGAPPAAAAEALARRGRLVLLAVDGVDPIRLERWMAEGRLPGFSRLKERGEYSWLRPTDPPTCEASWTALVTGLPPAESGVFGPHRVDHAVCGVLPGAVEVDAGANPVRVATRRSGTAFWTVAAQAGVRVRVLWAPFEVPPERLVRGAVLSGAGVPDVSGTPGRATVMSATFPEAVGATPGADRVRLVPTGTGWTAALAGPRGPGGGRIDVPVRVRRSPDPSRLVVDVPGYETMLSPGTWGPRMPVRFSAGALRVAGLARFLVLDAGELPVLYAAPVETSPEAPWVPLADPPEFAATLARRYGRCPTLGTPGDLHALAAGILPEEAYLGDLADDFAARAAIVLGEIDRGGFDLFVAFVPLVERVALGLERLADREHPRYDEERALAAAPGFGGVRLRDAVLAAYAYLDDLVGRVAGRLGPDDVLLLVSDHGLRPWRRAVHLNAWLRREGLLVLGAQEATGRPIWEGETPGLDDVDWTRTQAYAVGRGGIYVNLRGRESRGTVDPGERYDRLVERLAFKLGNWTDDGAGGAAVVRRVLVRGRDFRGRREEALPDLLVALADGYAASAETEAGLVPEAEVAPNASLIGADHDSADAADVPGLLFSTRPFGRGDATIVDVGATVLGFFGLRDAGGGRGRDLWGP